LLALWLAALALALIGLGNLPLRDWDEATIARVSLEISRSPFPEGLLPTYLGRAYLNKPPGLHLGIAGVIHLWQWTLGLALQAGLLVFPLRTQLPWYSLLLWPPFALACGAVLADLAMGARSGRLRRALGGLWTGLGGLLLIAALVLLLLPGQPVPAIGLLAVAPAGIGLLLGGRQLGWPGRGARPGRAILVMATGWFLALGVLFAGPLWNWELAEQPSIAPALALAAGQNGESPVLLLEGDGQTQRPSLLWYLNASSVPLEERGAPWPSHSFRMLARSKPGDLGAESRCRLEQSGEAGWNRWECRALGDHS